MGPLGGPMAQASVCPSPLYPRPLVSALPCRSDASHPSQVAVPWLLLLLLRSRWLPRPLVPVHPLSLGPVRACVCGSLPLRPYPSAVHATLCFRRSSACVPRLVPWFPRRVAVLAERSRRHVSWHETCMCDLDRGSGRMRDAFHRAASIMARISLRVGVIYTSWNSQQTFRNAARLNIACGLLSRLCPHIAPLQH